MFSIGLGNLISKIGKYIETSSPLHWFANVMDGTKIQDWIGINVHMLPKLNLFAFWLEHVLM